MDLLAGDFMQGHHHEDYRPQAPGGPLLSYSSSPLRPRDSLSSQLGRLSLGARASLGHLSHGEESSPSPQVRQFGKLEHPKMSLLSRPLLLLLWRTTAAGYGTDPCIPTDRTTHASSGALNMHLPCRTAPVLRPARPATPSPSKRQGGASARGAT